MDSHQPSVLSDVRPAASAAPSSRLPLAGQRRDASHRGSHPPPDSRRPGRHRARFRASSGNGSQRGEGRALQGSGHLPGYRNGADRSCPSEAGHSLARPHPQPRHALQRPRNARRQALRTSQNEQERNQLPSVSHTNVSEIGCNRSDVGGAWANNEAQVIREPRHCSRPSSRRPHEFRTCLSNESHIASRSPGNRSSGLPPRPVDLNEMTQLQRLTIEISSNLYDCSICISSVTAHQSIYHCPSCFAIFHLSCASKWASRSVSDTSTKARLLRDRDGVPCSEEAAQGEWRCPGCQHKSIGKETVPQKYYCWCGKVENPGRDVQTGQAKHSPLVIPHGCGMKCNKTPALGCTHGCTNECHPGSCPPCTAVINTLCHCGRVQKAVRCSHLHSNRPVLPAAREESLSCGEICSKALACGLHFCRRTCHSGDCSPCDVIRDKSCYCGQVVLAQQQCSQLTPEEFRSDISAEKSISYSPDGAERLGEFACKSRCPWKYDCEIHPCDSRCHPHPSPTTPICQLSPTLVKTCPCGSKPLLSRKVCTDPVATCTDKCPKVIAACGHSCQRTCHTGPCGPCKEPVTTVCRCGRDQIVRQCAELTLLKEEAVAQNSLRDAADRQEPEVAKMTAVEVRCERTCRVLRHCGKHICNRRCCPLAFLENILQGSKSKKTRLVRQHEQEDLLGLHICPLVCNKKLTCGLHSCQLQDHKGPCPTCLQASFDELVCHCGSTVVLPPVPCGAKIVCNQPCTRPWPACGHPKASHTCHEDPACPPCPYLTSRPCQCHRKVVVRHVRCSQPRVSCGQTCENVLGCGVHRCTRKCHLPGECEKCQQICAKPRKYCGHDCELPCHAPSACSTAEPCASLCEVKCPCGHLTQKIKCSSCDQRPDGNRDKTLKCNNECLMIQRNTALIEALDITSPSAKSPGGLEVSWSKAILQFFGANAIFARSIEKHLEELVTMQSPRAPDVIYTDSEVKRAFVCELALRFCLNFDIIDRGSRFGVRLKRTADSAIPQPLLSDMHESLHHVNTTTEILRPPKLKTDSMLSHERGSSTCDPMSSLMLEGVFGHDEGSMRDVLDPCLGNRPYNLTWVTGEDVSLTVHLTRDESHSPSGHSLAPERPSQNPGGPSKELEDILRAIITRNNQQLVKFCKNVFLIRQDSDGKALQRQLCDTNSSDWQSIGKPRDAKPSRWQGAESHKSIALSNSFAALSPLDAVNRRCRTKAIADQQLIGSGGIIGGGYHRPPMAVMAPLASSSRGTPGNEGPSKAEEVVDDWEDALEDEAL